MKLVKNFLTKNPYYQINVNRSDIRYTRFQDKGPEGGVLHSVGCSQPSALVFIQNWNDPGYYTACVHGFIDANDGVVHQTMPWNFRAPHCAGSANNTHIGVEMCESRYIRYFKVGEPGYAPAKFTVLDLPKAQEDCRRAYASAVELFAMLAEEFRWDVDTDIISHNEGGKRGVASGHVDPEHYWTQLGMPYNMDRFRTDVKACIEGTATEIPAAADDTSEEKVIWCVQIGAYKVKSNADALRDKVLKEGYAAILTVADGMYKVQVGAFREKRYAVDLRVKMIAAGYKAIVTKKPSVVVAADGTIRIGDLVHCNPGVRTYSDGKSMPKWVQNANLYVRKIEQDGAVYLVSIDETGNSYTGRVLAEDVHKV